MASVLDLSSENLLQIFDYAASESIALIRLEQVCRDFRRTAKENSLWLEVLKKEWQVTSSWDFDVQLLMSPRDWFWKRKEEIHQWREDIFAMKCYLEYSGLPLELLSCTTKLLEDLSAAKRNASPARNLTFAEFKTFREFFALVRKMLFTDCTYEFVSAHQRRLENMAVELITIGKTKSFDEVMSSSNNTNSEGTSAMSTLANDINVMLQLIGGINAITFKSGATEGFTWNESKRLVYVFYMMQGKTANSSYPNRIDCKECRNSLTMMGKNSKGVSCDRCLVSPGYFFAVSQKDKRKIQQIQNHLRKQQQKASTTSTPSSSSTSSSSSSSPSSTDSAPGVAKAAQLNGNTPTDSASIGDDTSESDAPVRRRRRVMSTIRKRMAIFEASPEGSASTPGGGGDGIDKKATAEQAKKRFEQQAQPAKEKEKSEPQPQKQLSSPSLSSSTSPEHSETRKLEHDIGNCEHLIHFYCKHCCNGLGLCTNCTYPIVDGACWCIDHSVPASYIKFSNSK